MEEGVPTKYREAKEERNRSQEFKEKKKRIILGSKLVRHKSLKKAFGLRWDKTFHSIWGALICDL